VNQGRQPIRDGDGELTGEWGVVYSEPIPMHGNVSPAKGEALLQQFGNDIQYEKIIAFAGKCPFKETDVLYIDNLIDGVIPRDNNGELVPHDFIVVRIAQSLNYTAVAINKVNVSN
jgi:hypothetical protein